MVCQTDPVDLGPIIIVAVLLVLPVALFMTGAVIAAALGFVLKKDIDDEYQGTEYLNLG